MEDPKETLSTLDTIPGYGMAVYRQIVYLLSTTVPYPACPLTSDLSTSC